MRTYGFAGPFARRARNCPRSREDGAMLIIALGVLTLMAILGAAFATLIRLEKKATENYIDAKRMDLLLDSALDRIVAALQGAKNFRHFSSSLYRDSPWLNMMKTRSGQIEGDLASGRVDVEDDRVGSWEVFTDRAGQVYTYKTKIIDCAAQIDLNGRQDTLARMLDNLGYAIERSDRLKLDGKKPTNPFYDRPRRQGNYIRGSQILQLRQRLPGGRFSSKSELKLLIGPENFEIVKDFVTVHAWEDPDTYKADDGLDEVSLLGVGVTGPASRGIGGAGGGQRQPAAHGVPRLSPEPRHPVNVNTAPEEVLTACLQGLAGRRVFPYSKLGAGGSIVELDSAAQILGERIPAGKEEFRDVTPRAVFIYTPRLEYDHAKRIADRIVQQRKQKPFMAWRTNDPGQPGFEDFIDSLDQSYFPAPTNCQVIDPDQPNRRDAEALIVRAGGANEVGRLWVKGHGQGIVRSLRQQLGLGFHEQFAWYYDLVKGVLKANFNPNSRINRYNPNSPAYTPVDKSDLVWLENRFSLRKGHTTEFCFDSMGNYEVTVLGRIAEKKRGAEPTTVAPGQRGGPAIDHVSFERKTRTVVKVFDVLRHTSQFHFGRTFASYTRTSANDRKFVVTWPEPLAALTEIWSTGSFRDGRIELAGLLDGRRLEQPVHQRTNSLRGYPSVLMVHTFQDRDPRSIANLQRVVQQGNVSRQGDQVAFALGEVLDAPFSRQKQTVNAKHLRRQELVSLGGNFNPDAMIADPRIDREMLGTDLFPDGLNTSLLRMSHLETRTLVLPARQRIGDASGGGGNPLVGASGVGSRDQNVLGNVAYYKGGIAFWCKFEFDGDDPVFSGLIGCTQVIREVMPAASDYSGSEGTQFFIFKNSKGQLRITRMYYHQAFPALASGGGSSGGGEDSTIKLYPDPGGASAEGGAAGGAGMQNPILEHLHDKKIISRSDILVDVSHFKAHEWHHIGLEFDDQNPAFPIRLFLDFQEVQEGRAYKPQQIIDGSANSWVRLNERQPRDGLQIASIVRDQGVSDAGVFKWFTNTTVAEGGSGVKTIAPSTKRILANATIDELISFENTFAGVKQYYGAQGSPGYFSQQPGEYANVFEIPLPADVDHVILRSFDWTSYYPTMYTDSRINSVPQRLQTTPIQCELTYNPGNAALPPTFFEPWRMPSVANQVAGRPVYRRATGLKGNNAELVYKMRLVGSRSQVGNTAGGVVQTPAVDDVTLTYFLPSPRILIQEDAD
ncbi:MAG: hypothetical protein HY721_29445 [Planctomycetes bacterium]|nr:hypothetical protein [Planctomycetota bacterium]